MKISYQWLMDYLPEPLPVAELADILTSIGLEVEAVESSETIKGGLAGLVIGQVLSAEKHPNADKLKLTQVDIGHGEPLQIVCGAPNVAAGQKVIVAPVGTTVHPVSGESFKIKKAKIRGVESEGMICAEDEIGLGNDHDGIIVLPQTAPVGTLAKEYYGIQEADQIIHIGLTPNRSDAMSHIGVARDVCAYLAHHRGKPYQAKLPQSMTGEKKGDLPINVTIEHTDACARYTGISIQNVQVADSPDWLKARLQAIGVRPVNNIVDITNYVLHEFGQPLHAFDADKISGRKVIVKYLPEGTVFETLDEKEIKLRKDDLMICDEEQALCLAGVYGGWESGVSENTKNVFLESAYFNPVSIRRSSMHHQLRTDAATHFEKGVDINNLIPALKRAASLIQEIAGGVIASEIVDVYPSAISPKKLQLKYAFIHKLSGKVYEKKTVKTILSSLGFIIENETEEEIILSIPTNKTDVAQPADIVEEIIRIDGLNNIPIPERLNISLLPSKRNDAKLKGKIASVLCGLGFREIITNSIINSKYFPERNDLVKMINNLSSELDAMRPSLLESGLEVIQYNCNRKQTDLALFEFGQVYQQKENGYSEEPQLAVWVTGNTESAQWNQKAKPADLYYLKGVIEQVCERAGIRNIQFSYGDQGIISLNQGKNKLAELYETPAAKLKNFDIDQPVYFAVFYWNVLLKSASDKVSYSEIPRFPEVHRDLALVLDKQVSYEQIEQATEQLKIPTLKAYNLFDVFESEKLGADKKSYALSYTFQSSDRTLTEEEIGAVMKQLAEVYKSKLQAQIREQ